MTDLVYKQLNYMAETVTRLEESMIDPREFGRLEGAVSALKTELDSVKDRQVAIDGKLDQVLEKLSEAKGGWRLSSTRARAPLSCARHHLAAALPRWLWIHPAR